MSYLRNNKLLLLVIGVLLVANISLLWFYVWKKPEKTVTKRPTERASDRLKREIGFTTQQATTYDSIREHHYSSIRPMFEDLRASRDSLFKLMHQPLVDDSLIALQSEIVYEKQKAIDLKMHRYFRSLRDLGTEEQKPRIDSFLNNLAKKMANGRRWGAGEKKDKKPN
jgi:Spy/CpxP family protein refolding chaperone